MARRNDRCAQFAHGLFGRLRDLSRSVATRYVRPLISVRRGANFLGHPIERVVAQLAQLGGLRRVRKCLRGKPHRPDAALGEAARRPAAKIPRLCRRPRDRQPRSGESRHTTAVAGTSPARGRSLSPSARIFPCVLAAETPESSTGSRRKERVAREGRHGG